MRCTRAGLGAAWLRIRSVRMPCGSVGMRIVRRRRVVCRWAPDFPPAPGTVARDRFGYPMGRFTGGAVRCRECDNSCERFAVRWAAGHLKWYCGWQLRYERDGSWQTP